jgi:two-component system, LuxR family, sensor kinase FixL
VADSVVLLVDDNGTHSYALSKHLEESGFRVLLAADGETTLDLAQKEQPDVILLDINLPDMTGFDICEKLKDAPRTSRIPVIFHSATHDTASARSRAADLGAASFLNYPINIEHLVYVIRGAIAQGPFKESKQRLNGALS